MFAKKVKLDSQVIFAMFDLEPGLIITHPFAQISSFIILFCLMYLNDENTDVVIV